MSKKLGAVHCHNSLVLRYACKALSKTSSYKQVLFHKTCAVSISVYAFFTVCYYQYIVIVLSARIGALQSLLSFDEKITCLSFDFCIIFIHCNMKIFYNYIRRTKKWYYIFLLLEILSILQNS